MGKKVEKSDQSEYGKLQELLASKEEQIQALNLEIKIESALEKVRNCTMSIHRSDELADVVAVLYEEIKQFKLADWGSSIQILDEEKHAIEIWLATDLRESLPKPYYFRGAGHPAIKKLWDSFKTREPRFDLHLQGEAKKSYDNYVLVHTDFRRFPKEMKESIKALDKVFAAYARMKYGYIVSVNVSSPLTDEKFGILSRFAKIFEQTYTRFLDLKKAEAQAEEAQVEASVERIRARGMAMYKTSELAESTAVLFNQLDTLGIHPWRAGITILNDDLKEFEIWTRTTGQEDTIIGIVGKTNAFGHRILRGIYKAWKNRDPFFKYYLSGDELKDYLDYTTVDFDLPEATADTDTLPKRLVYYHIPFEQGTLYGTFLQPILDTQLQILQRFAQVFGQTYVRYLDLKKAEAQTREALIEAALERVRARALAMHQSEELHSVITLLFEQTESLGLSVNSIVLHENVSDKGDHMTWVAANGQLYPFRIYIPYIEHEWFNKFNIARKAGVDFISDVFSKADKNKWFDNYFNNSSHQTVPVDRKDFIYSCSGLTRSTALQDNTALTIMRYDSIPFSEQDNNLLKRFARVFDQTYTRFLDLQKAEAQAREAQIEAALERVRARAMAMHQSDELAETSTVLFEQMKDLGIQARRVGFAFVKDDGKIEIWSTIRQQDGSAQLLSGYIYDHQHPLLTKVVVSYKKKEESFFDELHGDELKAYYRAIQKTLDFSDEMKTVIDQAGSEYYHLYNFGDGLIYAFAETAFSEEENQILKRFTQAFGLIYRRFLDLQRAESQTREAEVEAALERIRAASMAMHHSDDFPSVADIILRQLELLDIPIFGIGIIVVSEDEKNYVLYFADNSEKQGKTELLITKELPIQDFWLSREVVTKLKAGETESLELVEGKKMEVWLDWVATHVSKKRSMRIRKLGLKNFWIYNIRFHHLSNIVISSFHQFDEFQWNACRRIAITYGMSYRRLLELKKAEAQAKEAQIEAALERVRARTMAMHQPEEMKEVVSKFFESLKQIGIDTSVCNILIINETTLEVENWAGFPSDDGISSYVIHIPLLNHPFWINLIETHRNKVPYTVHELSGNSKKEFDSLFFEKADYSLAPEAIRKMNRDIKQVDRSFLGAASMKYGLLTFARLSPIVEAEVALLERFAKVFQQAYTRFLDLQKAETQAREAQIEAALERVRAKAMSMHSSEDVENATISVFQELRKLGIQTIRCGIIIFGESLSAEVWTVTMANDGITLELGGGFVDLNMHQVTVAAYKKWKKRANTFHFELKGSVREKYYQSLSKDNYKNPENELIKEDHWANAYFFSEGALLAFTQDKVDDEISRILKRFTNVFNLTYRRYLDLKEAEASAEEAKIEAALERVRARSMAMHQPEELEDTAAVLFHQLEELGIQPWRSGITIMDKSSKTMKLWSMMRSKTNEKVAIVGTIDAMGHPVTKKVYEDWEKNMPLFKFTIEGEELIEFFNYISRDFRLPDETNSKNSWPNRLIYYAASFRQGFIYSAFQLPIPADQESILKRFSKVFEQTYIRYLDLKVAEANAREAIQQASLDRVRAEIASMRTSEDLKRITPLIWKELTTLEVPFFRCGLFIVDEQNQSVESYLTTPDGKPLAALTLPYGKIEFMDQTVESWRKKKVYTNRWNKQQFIEFSQSILEQGLIESQESYQGAEEAPDMLNMHFVPFNQGMLYVGSSEALDEEQIDLLGLLASTFSVAYARYEDFIELEKAKTHVETALKNLKAAQSQLVQSEKMASLGELTAGIAHEIQNPLNFVNNFSELNKELIEEMIDEIKSGNMEEVRSLAENISTNEEKIAFHGHRADGIVKSMLQHSRMGSGERELVDINELCDEYFRLAYHGMRAKHKGFNAEIETDFDPGANKIHAISQEISRVMLNLFTNAFHAVNSMITKSSPTSGSGYKPSVKVMTKYSTRVSGEMESTWVEIRVIDNGPGIPDNIKDKIFQPFFTTKPTGQGTGLGLSLSYDIVKAHGGELIVLSQLGEGSEFIVLLPAG